MPDQDKLRLGGMALRNGLLVHGPTSWAAAVRTRDGQIKVASGRKPRLSGRSARVPGARGVVRLGEADRRHPARQARAARGPAALPGRDRARRDGRRGDRAARVLRRRVRGAGGEIALAALSVAPSIVALRGGDLAAYHGVEHKAIAAYEQDDADARDAAKEHDRCGSHLMAPLLAANVAGTLLLRGVVAHPAQLHQGAVQLASLGAAVEVFAWSERHEHTAAARALRRPGHELQRVRRHARADRGAARGRPGGAGGDPARRRRAEIRPPVFQNRPPVPILSR